MYWTHSIYIKQSGGRDREENAIVLGLMLLKNKLSFNIHSLSLPTIDLIDVVIDSDFPFALFPRSRVELNRTTIQEYNIWISKSLEYVQDLVYNSQPSRASSIKGNKLEMEFSFISCCCPVPVSRSSFVLFSESKRVGRADGGWKGSEFVIMTRGKVNRRGEEREEE